MHKQLLYALFLVSQIFFFSCANKGLYCAGKSKKYKHKEYRVKKSNKRVGYGYGGGGTSASTPTDDENSTDTQEAIPEEPVETAEDSENANETRETAQPSIPDLKTAGPPIDEEVIQFRGEDVVLSETKDFQFDENIEFIDLSDLFVNRETAFKSLEDLSRLLKRNPDVEVTIVGNTATSIPQSGGELYGDSPEVLRQEAILNADTVQIRDVMIARAKRVYELLIDEGVRPNQIEYTTGSHRKWEAERVVSFILRKED